MKRTALVAIALCVATFGLAACSSGSGESISQQANKGDDKNYIAGDGTVVQLASSDRGKPVLLTGKLLDGQPWSSADYAGKIIVVNAWGSWCPPCQAEMPQLEAAWKQFQKQGNIVMIGVDLNEGPQTAAAYLESVGVTYPSLQSDGGKALLELQNKATATPSTLVLDSQHRIAARVAGATTESTLLGLVQDAEGSK
ncbi:TlpA family protein disulfide reductase [Rudaeicoccus suwonensis]|uniref:Thiol-disulfide isomerase/thioredoxin n=1 Tax=Rudaeicoccus suwonensis TaxID=657409 RepID=A0A561DU49_9MICO|nr:TlpA disulfide reductase family protein [Rudaeicoccus suwonensis]TWE06895.1 thiol-disulfide isomerase/thioredoxin [Rudaeicoccus suwonensis]